MMNDNVMVFLGLILFVLGSAGGNPPLLALGIFLLLYGIDKKEKANETEK